MHKSIALVFAGVVACSAGVGEEGAADMWKADAWALGAVASDAPHDAEDASATVGLTWPVGQPFPTFAKATAFDVVNAFSSAKLGGTAAEMGYLLTTLQGLVNRKQPRIWLPGNNMDFWLSQAVSQAKVATTAVSDPADLLTKYRSEIADIVIYDDTCMDTVNLATAIAGVSTGIVVAPALASALKASPYAFKVIADLRTNNFNAAAVKDGVTVAQEVYGYELTSYVLTHKTSNRTLVGVMTDRADSLRDYAVATGAAVFWLDPQVAGDKALLDQYLASVLTDSPYMGWWTQEQAGVSAAGSKGVPTFAANHAQDLTAMAGVKVTIAPPVIPAMPKLQNKVYVGMFLSDGDNIAENENLIPTKWMQTDPLTHKLIRGQVPISWTVQPGLATLAPIILNYFWTTATTTDVLVSGPSGVGYTYARDWTASAYATYAENSVADFQTAGLRVITNWNNGMLLQNAQDVAQSNAYATKMPHLFGLTQQVAPSSPSGQFLTKLDGTMPVLSMACSYASTVTDVEKGDGTNHCVGGIDGQLAQFNGSKPVFVAVQGDDNVGGVDPLAFLQIQSHYASNPNVVFVRGDHLFQLIRASMGLTTTP